MATQKPLTGRMVQLPKDRFIVSKSDLEGRITYANRVFMEVCGYIETELIGKPHNLIRHPDMPRCVFAQLWETLRKKEEFFGYIKNRCANGDHYWVMAYVVAEEDTSHRVIGYTSFRRAIKEGVIEKIEPLYARLRQEEEKTSPQQAWTKWMAELREQGMTYEQFVLGLHGDSGTNSFRSKEVM